MALGHGLERLNVTLVGYIPFFIDGLVIWDVLFVASYKYWA